MRKALPNLDAELAKGDTSSATAWLGANVQTHGGLYEPRAVIEQASGQVPSEAPLLGYLKDKFSGIYGL
jgi:carboxypeptidase Taq